MPCAPPHLWHPMSTPLPRDWPPHRGHRRHVTENARVTWAQCHRESWHRVSLACMPASLLDTFAYARDVQGHCRCRARDRCRRGGMVRRDLCRPSGRAARQGQGPAARRSGAPLARSSARVALPSTSAGWPPIPGRGRCPSPSWSSCCCESSWSTPGSRYPRASCSPRSGATTSIQAQTSSTHASGDCAPSSASTWSAPGAPLHHVIAELALPELAPQSVRL